MGAPILTTNYFELDHCERVGAVTFRQHPFLCATNASELASGKAYDNVAEAVAYFEADPLISRPGVQFVYSTYGYTLLSAAIEGASGKQYLSLMQEAVFKPLGMHNTCPDVPQRVIADRTGFYYRTENELLNGPFIDTSNKWAGGGFLSSANDLVRFGLAIFSDNVIRSDTRKLLWTSQKTGDGQLTGYGMGWFVGKDTNHNWVQHPGGTVGGSALVRIYPEDRTVIVILANLSMLGDDRFEDLPDRLFREFANTSR